MRRGVLTALTILVLAGTSAAFALTEALKLEPSPVTTARVSRVFSPVCGCTPNVARIAVGLREADAIDVAILDDEGDTVRALARALERPAGIVRLTWDGTDDGGRRVADALYRVRVHFRRAGRTVVLPRAVRVDTVPPAVTVTNVEPRVLGPDGEVVVFYAANERSRPVLLVDGVPAARKRRGAAGERTLVWRGRVHGRLVPSGRHELVVRVRDRAGNVADSVPFVVRVARGT